MDARAEYVMVQRGGSPSATSLANLDVEKESAAPIDIKGAAPASSSVVKLPEGSSVMTKGAVTAYRPKGDPYRYTYNADTKAFSVYNLDGTPVRENVTQGMSGYEDFLKHAGGGRTKYFRGATSSPKAESSQAKKKDTAVSEETAAAPVAEEAAPAPDEPAPLLDFDQDSAAPTLTAEPPSERQQAVARDLEEMSARTAARKAIVESVGDDVEPEFMATMRPYAPMLASNPYLLRTASRYAQMLARPDSPPAAAQRAQLLRQAERQARFDAQPGQEEEAVALMRALSNTQPPEERARQSMKSMATTEGRFSPTAKLASRLFNLF
jgi:hypothetical protein